MSLAAARGAASNATVQLPLGQLAVVGLGAFCVTNPDKFFNSLAKGLHFVSTASAALSVNNNNPGSASSQGAYQNQPSIIIHQSSPASSSYRGYVIQLLLSASLCWGSYVFLIRVLPEQAKGMLPVTTNRFNRSITSLGRAVINLKDTLMQQIDALSGKQDELSSKQNDTHEEVLNVKDNVEDVRGEISVVTESLELCHTSLAESERRISYIARGVQLLTRGVSTFLPEDEALLHELVQFNTAGEEFNEVTPLQQRRLQQALRTIQGGQGSSSNPTNSIRNGNTSTGYYGTIHRLAIPNSSSTDENSTDPENEVPSTPAPGTVEDSMIDLHALLESVNYQSYGRTAKATQ